MTDVPELRSALAAFRQSCSVSLCKLATNDFLLRLISFVHPSAFPGRINLLKMQDTIIIILIKKRCPSWKQKQCIGNKT